MFKNPFIDKRGCNYWLNQGNLFMKNVNEVSDFYEKKLWRKKAMFAYEIAKQKNYYCYMAWFKLGNVYMDMDLFEEATKYYTKLLDYFKIKSAEIYLHRGLCFHNLNKKNEAIFDYWRVVNSNTGDENDRCVVAEFLYDLLKEQKTLSYSLLKKHLNLPGINIMMLKCAQIMGPNRRVDKVVERFKKLIFGKNVTKW